MDVVTREYRITPQELFRVSVRRSYRLFWVVPVIGVALGIYISSSGNPTDTFLGVFEAALSILAPGIRSVITVLMFKRTPLNRRSYTARFSDDNLVQESEGENYFKARYTDLLRVSATREALLLFLTPISYAVVPRRAFESEADFSEVTANFKRLGILK